MVFVPGEKKLPDGIELDKTGSRSVPMKLLATTDKYYIVVPNTPGQLSVELNLEYVAEMVVLVDK